MIKSVLQRHESRAAWEEVGETWQHVVSDETVYFCDVGLGQFELGPGSIDWFPKYKLGRLWFDAHIVFGGERNGEFHCLVKNAAEQRHIGTGGRDRDVCVTEGHRRMFVEIAQLVQLPQGVRLEGVPSDVWLQRLDYWDRGGGHVARRRPELFPTLFPRVAVDGKQIPARRYPAVDECQLPRQVVKGGAQRIRKLANRDGDSWGRRIQFDANDVQSLFAIVFFVTA